MTKFTLDQLDAAASAWHESPEAKEIRRRGLYWDLRMKKLNALPQEAKRPRFRGRF